MPITLATGSGTIRAKLSERANNLYETPPCAVHALLAVESLPIMLWEPACGPGAIVRILRAGGREVVATDLVDWGCPDSESGRDFLMETAVPAGTSVIVTNPPFKLADEFAVHAIRLAPKACLLLRGAFLEGLRWYRPDEHPRGLGLRDHLARVWMFAPRLPFMHRHGYDGPRNSNSGMPFAWFVFERDAARYSAAQVRWINPRDYEPESKADPPVNGHGGHTETLQGEFEWGG